MTDEASMTDSDPVDYTALSGANFQRVVGTDPEKWAAALWPIAFQQPHSSFGQKELARWFADAMEAAREEGRHMERKITGQFW